MTATNANSGIEILLVEDSEDDIELTTEALAVSKMQVSLQVVKDGLEAVRYLRREGAYRDTRRPDLILLDLNLPRMDGREVLTEIKQDPDLRTSPVVVLTTSHDEADIHRAYSSHANCYVTKPVNFDQFTKIVRSIEDFWFTVVRLPKEE